MNAEELPAPDGETEDGAWWRLSSGERVYAGDSSVYAPDFYAGGSLDALEQDAYALLAAVKYARQTPEI